MESKIKTAYNSTYPKVAVQRLNQALCFYQSLCLVDSEVLRNRHLRVAAKRCMPCYQKTKFRINYNHKLNNRVNYDGTFNKIL